MGSIETELSNQVYECHNSQCTLGSRKEPGLFTGGMTEAGLELIYGTTTEEDRTTEGIGFGEGYCPNCGQKGTPATDQDGEPLVHESIVGEDPNQHFHDIVGSKVLDPNDSLKPEEAQAILEELVNETSVDDNDE